MRHDVISERALSLSETATVVCVSKQEFLLKSGDE